MAKKNQEESKSNGANGALPNGKVHKPAPAHPSDVPSMRIGKDCATMKRN